jgi:hypothetical protein
MSTSYHPQTDGQTEIMNKHNIAYLRHYIPPLGKYWAKHLANAEFALKNHTSSTTGQTPFFLLHNRHPNTPLSLLHPKFNEKTTTTPRTSKTQWLLSREAARTSMRLSQDRMAVNANMHRRDVSYNVGDMVYISSKTVTAGTEIAKLKVHRIGPSAVLEKHNPVAYKINIPYKMVANNVFPVYHVSKLKLANTTPLQPSPEPTALPSEVLEQPTREYPVQSILNRQVNKGVEQYRIRWGLPYSPADDSWEDAIDIENCEALDVYLDSERVVNEGLRRSNGNGNGNGNGYFLFLYVPS